MCKEGLEALNDLIKIFSLLLCTSVTQDKEINWIIITCISIKIYTRNEITISIISFTYTNQYIS